MRTLSLLMVTLVTAVLLMSCARQEVLFRDKDNSENDGNTLSVEGTIDNPREFFEGAGQYVVAEATAEEKIILAKSDAKVNEMLAKGEMEKDLAYARATDSLSAMFRIYPESIGNFEKIIEAEAQAEIFEKIFNNGNDPRSLHRQNLNYKWMYYNHKIQSRRNLLSY